MRVTKSIIIVSAFFSLEVTRGYFGALYLEMMFSRVTEGGSIGDLLRRLINDCKAVVTYIALCTEMKTKRVSFRKKGNKNFHSLSSFSDSATRHAKQLSKSFKKRSLNVRL